MGFLDVLVIILVISAIILCFFLIYWFKHLDKKIDSIQRDVHDIYERSIPILDNLKETTDNLNNITNEAQNKLNTISELVENTKEKFSWLAISGESHKSTQPAENLVNRLKALSRGISAFFAKLR